VSWLEDEKVFEPQNVFVTFACIANLLSLLVETIESPCFFLDHELFSMFTEIKILLINRKKGVSYSSN
jgi:hypothetical protein